MRAYLTRTLQAGAGYLVLSSLQQANSAPLAHPFELDCGRSAIFVLPKLL
jgi:hypothetical protein